MFDMNPADHHDICSLNCFMNVWCYCSVSFSRLAMFDLVEMKKGIDVNRMDINWQIELLSSPIRTKNDKIKLKNRQLDQAVP